MFEEWRAKRPLQKLERERDRDYTKEKANLRTEEDYWHWRASWDADIELARDDYKRARTSHWRRKAVHSFVELPPRGEQDGYWEETWDMREWVLTDRGVAYVRSEVRREKLASSELTVRLAYLSAAVVVAAASAVAIFL